MILNSTFGNSKKTDRSSKINFYLLKVYTFNFVFSTMCCVYVLINKLSL